MLEFITPHPNSIFNIPNTLGLVDLTKLRLGLSHLRNHKYRRNICDSLSPICDCGEAVETPKHYLLPCSNFIHERQSLQQNIEKINPTFLTMNDNSPQPSFYFMKIEISLSTLTRFF